ncbi:hypothetical protein D3C87_1306190 [compost metagenome]
MSKTSELTQPPFDQGEAMINGTRYPSPTGPSVAFSLFSPASSSCCRLTNSPEISIPGETLPDVGSAGLGATKGGI